VAVLLYMAEGNRSAENLAQLLRRVVRIISV
jgi:hypothetical protein